MQFVTRQVGQVDSTDTEPDVLRDYRAIVLNAGDGIIRLDPLLPKPFTADALLSLLDEVVDRRHRRPG